MQKNADGKKLIGILVADIHLSVNPPLWRSAEPDWFAAMDRPLSTIRHLQQENDCYVFCAGDLFDLWYGADGKRAAELVNFAMKKIPKKFVSIPGQHDMPLHNYKDIEKSVYWTLVQAGSILNVPPKEPIYLSDINTEVYAFPYGTKVVPLNLDKHDEDRNHIALIHEYLWKGQARFEGAPASALLTPMKACQYNGYDLVVVGDNHIGFMAHRSSTTYTTIFNCGSLIRRKLDERYYRPQIGLLYEDGSVKPYDLSTGKDKYIEVQSKKAREVLFNMKGFIEELERLGRTDLDFRDAVKQFLKKEKVKRSIRNIILEAMET